MDKDKAIRSALLTAKGMDNKSENIADYVADLLRQGRASEITNDLMSQADPQRLYHHYTTGNTGQPMPMDYASRMERAAQMGFDTKAYRGQPASPDQVLNTIRTTGKTAGTGSWATSNPDIAATYTGRLENSPSTLPLMLKGGNYDTHDYGGNMWAEGPEGKTSDDLARASNAQGVAFKNIVDVGPHLWNRADVQKRLPESADSYAIKDPTSARSQFARFDPRLEHLAHLSASTGGAMELARAVVAKNRAGGQIAPSKYLPNVPRAVHADGGRENGADGITAYHGSPHSFDQFDIANLGTGNGGQAYGHGIYFTGTEKTAKSYRDALSRKISYDGNPVSSLHPSDSPQARAIHSVARHIADGTDIAKKMIDESSKWRQQADEYMQWATENPQHAAEARRSAKSFSDVADEIDRLDYSKFSKDSGHMYKVKLNVQPNELLDWDKPLSEQPEVARKLGYASQEEAEQSRNASQPLNHWGNFTGKSLHDKLVSQTGSKKGAADAMQAAGLKGIKYLDNGFLDPSGGDPTHNYVMFHHDPIEIKEKYEYGGAVGKEEGGATVREGSLREKGLWPSAQAIKAGTGSRKEHAEMVNKIKPVSPYAAPVPPASDQQVHDALTSDKKPKAFVPRSLDAGTPVAVRLDIPAYEKRNTWVVSVHHPKSDFTAGEVIGYDSVAHIDNPRFGVHPTGALNIASGKPKSTIATVHGNWKKTTPEDAAKLSQTVHNDPQWRQVGMDPERHSYFYDRETQEPIMSADEALHIGPLVYAKNPVYGKKTDFAFNSGGRVGYDNGGSPLGLYSKAAQIIRNQPQAKGNVDQLLAMVSKAKGVKPTELANAGRPAGDTMTKEELAQHFEQALPDVQVEKLGGRDSNYPTKYDKYTLPNGTNYREHLLHLPLQEGPLAKRKKALQDQWQQAYENQAPKEELDRLGAEFDSLPHGDDEEANFKSPHWKTPNVLAHVRMDEHDNGKTLHVQEVQSDWGQEGREKGFHDPENPFEVIHKKTNEVVSRHPDYRSMTDAWRDHPDRENLTYGDVGDEKPPQGPYVGNTQQWTDLALKHILTEAAKNKNYDRVVFSPGEVNADLYGQRKEVQMLKFLKSKDSGEAGILSAYSKDGRRSSEHEVGSHGELAKLIGKKNATNLLAQPQTTSPDYGEDRYTHTLQGPLIVGGHGMVDYYKNYVHQGALKLLQQHDPSIKPDPYELPGAEFDHGFSLPMTDTARQSILKNGFQAFKDGGEVHKATGGPVMGYVPTAPIQIRKLAVAPIVPQQQQQPAARFSQSLGSLMDTVNEFKKKPEEIEQPVTAPAPSASSEGHSPSGMIPLPEQGYQPSGMYAPFQSAIDQMIADAPGKISVASGYRTPERQAELWEGAASKYPDPEVRDNWVARPGTSSHNYGLAADLSYADKKALEWAQENAARYGLNFRMDNENWHIEPTNVFDIRSAMTIPGYATGGSVSKALSVTRGFTKDGKSAIGSLKPKGK